MLGGRMTSCVAVPTTTKHILSNFCEKIVGSIFWFASNQFSSLADGRIEANLIWEIISFREGSFSGKWQQQLGRLQPKLTVRYIGVTL